MFEVSTGQKNILSINIHDNRYDFQVIFGKAERKKFEVQRAEFPLFIQEIYDGSKTHYDGKWMLIPVADLGTLEVVKKLILIKKNPNRKPFPKEQAIYSGYPCAKATAGWPPRIELKRILADDVTWAILPYVDGQYGN